MKINYIIISMAAAAILFTACEGGGDAPKKVDTPIEAAVSIKNSVKSFKAVAGERKIVTMSTGKDVITAGEPNSLFSVVSVDPEATASFDPTASNGNNYGLLRFQSTTTGTYNVVINVKNSAGTSEDATFAFEVVSESDADSLAETAVLATDRTDYTRDVNTDYNVHDTITGLTWLDNNDVNDIVNRTYSSAKEAGCQSPWRLPTLNELLDVIDYSKPYLSASMLSDTFTQKEHYMWVEEKNGQNYFVNTFIGMPSVDTAGQELSYRCVKGDKYETEHLISTDIATGAIYDYTTGLKWSKAKLVVGVIGAEEYCGGTIHEDSDWRLPTINELRSMVEDGIVPSGIVAKSAGGQHLTLFSSTSSNDEENEMHYGLVLNWDRTEPLVVRYYDAGENANYSATCVKEL